MSTGCLGQWGLAVRGDGRKERTVGSPCTLSALPLVLGRTQLGAGASPAVPRARSPRQHPVTKSPTQFLAALCSPAPAPRVHFSFPLRSSHPVPAVINGTQRGGEAGWWVLCSSSSFQQERMP